MANSNRLRTRQAGRNIIKARIMRGCTQTWGVLFSLTNRQNHLLIKRSNVTIKCSPGSRQPSVPLFTIKRVCAPATTCGYRVFLHRRTDAPLFVNDEPVTSKLTRLPAHSNIAMNAAKTPEFLFVDYQLSEKGLKRRRRVKKICSDYYVDNYIAGGAFGKVFHARHRRHGFRCALKVARKDRCLYFNVYNEIDILQQVRHPFSVQLLDFKDTDENIFLFMEAANGGSMSDRFVGERRYQYYSILEVKVYFFQIAHACAYLHSIGIVHRDLKLANILMMRPCRFTVTKLTDYGGSIDTKGRKRAPLNEYGTPAYWAPEVFMRTLFNTPTCMTSKSDVWSLGVMLYMCITQQAPFQMAFPLDRDDIDRTVMRGFPHFSGEVWQPRSSPRGLVMAMLEKNPDARLSMLGVINDPWFRDSQMIGHQRRLLKEIRAASYTMPRVVKKWRHKETLV